MSQDIIMKALERFNTLSEAVAENGGTAVWMSYSDQQLARLALMKYRKFRRWQQSGSRFLLFPGRHEEINGEGPGAESTLSKDRSAGP